MKTLFCLLIAVLLFFIPAISSAQKIDSPYEVATWFEFRDGAVSYTFDDGCANQFAKAIPIFDEFGYKTTLFTVINWSTANWTKLQSAAKNGHEIASHTVSHLNFTGVSADKQLPELENSRLEIDKQIPNAKCLTLAYPNCAKGDYSVVRKNYISARGCQGIIEGKTPADFLNISSIVCGSVGSLKTAADLNSKITSAIAAKGWLVYLFHGIDDDGGYSPFPSADLRKNLEYVKSIDSRIWVATFLDATRYVRERNAINVKESAVTDNDITLLVTDTLDNAVFNQAVSLRRPLPTGWAGAEVTQNGKSLASKMIESGTSGKIQFNVVPDAGEIKISKSLKTGLYVPKVKEPGGSNPMKVWMNNAQLYYTLPVYDANLLKAEIYNINGIKVLDKEIACDNSDGSIDLATCRMLPGNYILSIKSNSGSWTTSFRMF